MERPDRGNQPAVAKLVKDGFAIYLEGRSQKFGEERRRVMVELSSRRNTRGYIPALTELACRHLTRDILRLAKLYVKESTELRVACDPTTDRELEAAATQLAGGTMSGIHGDLHLLRKRTNMRLNLEQALGHINRTIGAAKRLAVRRGKLMLARQRILQNRGSPAPVRAVQAASVAPRGTLQQPPRGKFRGHGGTAGNDVRRGRSFGWRRDS